MIEPIDLLKKELTQLKYTAQSRTIWKKEKANTLISAYENTINIMEKVSEHYVSHDTALNIDFVTQRSELLKALNGIIACCDGNNSAHEEIYHIANDAVKAFNCG